MGLWFLILLVISSCTVRVDGQLDQGFLSIDCGLDTNSSYIDSDTTLTYVSDDQFIDSGLNNKIATQYVTNNLFKQFLNVRNFPNGTRNCYTLRSLTKGSRYLVRGTFMYGNYDKLNKPPIFDLHLGINYWHTVNISTVDDAFFAEIIATATYDYLQVCLVDMGHGTPFISALDLRPLGTSIYKIANATQSLVYAGRLNIGESHQQIRYPYDQYDRIWIPYMQNIWKNISTSSTFDPDKDFAVPSVVLQTAATTLSTNQSLDLSLNWNGLKVRLYVILHIREIQNIPPADLREFDIFAEDYLYFNSTVLPNNFSDWFTIEYDERIFYDYNVSLKPTLKSTLPPLLNAFEVYFITPASGIHTNDGDVIAISTIKANYKVNKGWSGDPCVPTEFTWTGVTCTSDSLNIPRITALDLSSSGLSAAIISSFGDLSSLKSLDLSYNDLSGDLPAFLDKLSALTYLDITGNNRISTTLPPGLLSKKQDGNLIFKFGNWSAGGDEKKKKSPVVIIAASVGVVVLLVIAASIILIVCLRKHKNSQPNNPEPYAEHATTPRAYNPVRNHVDTTEANITNNNDVHQNYPRVSNPNKPGEGIGDQNRRFSYNDLVKITNKFENNIGAGGFGSVCMGSLEDGTQVAVKLRSDSSSQGVKEFLAEAQNLGRVHHRNLVSLLGYCMDGDCMALVYEYMQEGTLNDKLMDNAWPLSWKQRVQIAYESALGLNYLHKSCNPPLIHRDVKTSNILLNENFEARIADFGLSRAINNATNNPVSTIVVGTPGYLDPEYYSSNQLSEKSDVFSFGVVLLEIITGRSPIIAGLEGGHLKQWVNQKLSRGDIEGIVDSRLNGYYDINSVWKVTELARKCTENIPAQRPAMSMVVTELKESLDLEISTEGARGKSTAYNRPHNYSRDGDFANDVSQNSVFEMRYMGGMSGAGPIAR